MATIKVSDITNVPATAKTIVNTVPVVIDGESYEIDMTAQELGAFLALFREGHDAAPLRALLATETATAATPVKRATGKAKTDSKTDTAALLASVRAWADRTEVDSTDIRAWAHVNGFPHVEPSKAGRLAGDVWISYALAHGGPAAPAPAAPADSLPAANAAQEAAKASSTNQAKQADAAPAKNAKTPAASASKTPAAVK
jgi:hypothetical protein